MDRFEHVRMRDMAQPVCAPVSERTSGAEVVTDREGGAARTMMDVLDSRAHGRASSIAYTFLQDGEVESSQLTFGELHLRALAIAARLTRENARGDRAILLYPQGLEFIVAFFGCLYAGVIAVPASLPGRKRGLEILRRVAQDAGAKWLLSTGSLLEQLAGDMGADAILGAMSRLDTEAMPDEVPANWVPLPVDPSKLALLQYTSGSTGSPRGVAVTHANLMFNQRQIEQCFGENESRLVSWLPMFHDMGLGTVLQATWVGGSCVLMSPHAFLQNPRRWLAAISHYRGTISGAPDFAFDLCARRIRSEERAGLDLSSWHVAYNGSEPVKAATIASFAQAFCSCGFRREAFHPVYGLAEATLLVTSEHPSEHPVIRSFSMAGLERGQGKQTSTRGLPLVSCGRPWPGTHVVIVEPETGEECPPGRIGEIWVRGASVAAGYWGKNAETQTTFRATTADGNGPFLRTGDLGFIDDGHLFVTGRLKDLIIVHGLNHHPQDIEASASGCHEALVPHGCAAFSIDGPGGERLVVVQEVNRSALRTLDAASVVRAIQRAVSDDHGLSTYAVVLVKPSTLPRTSSGKLRRQTCRGAFLEKSLDAVASSVAKAPARGQQGPVELLGAAVTPVSGPPAAVAPEPESSSARADGLIEWLRRHAADSIGACALNDSNAVFSLFRAFGRQGLFGMQVEPEYGGSGLGHFDSARVLEQLAAIDFRLSLLVGLNNYLGIEPIARYATRSTKALLLPGLARGEEFAAFGLTEPSGGPSSSTVSTRADPDEPGRFRLFGTKYLHCVAQGATVISLFARHEEPAGVSAFVVSEGSDGLRRVTSGLTMGILGFPQETIVLDGVRVGPENLLGSYGSGMAIGRESMMHALLAIGAACIGGMKRCAQFASRHGPYQGDVHMKRTPNPVILSRLGSVTARITALECVVHRIARALDGGQRVRSEAFATCRILGPELLLRSVDDLMQLGVNGNTAESHRLAGLYRDAGLLCNFDGPSEAVAEATGALVMEGGGSLRSLLEEVFDAPDAVPSIDHIVTTVRHRMKTLRGALARRPQRWGHTRAGELGTWLVLLAAVDGSRREAPSQELERAHAWAHAQFEHALSSVRFGTPSETATVEAADVAATLATYARAIGDFEEDLAVAGDAPRAVAPWAGFIARDPSRPDFFQHNLQPWISSWLAARLQVPISEIDMERSFADHGLDSVAAVELAVALSDKLGCKLDQTLLWNFPTIGALLEWSSTGAPRGEAHFEADAVLDGDVQPHTRAIPSGAPSSVLLTGATGFVGAFLLYELLKQTSAQVNCLVRAADSVAGRERVMMNLRQYGLWKDAFKPRITIWVGDLAAPRLGLDDATYDHLADEVDAIYNNGALLSFVAAYNDLKPSHVTATRELLRLALRGRPKLFHHISSVVVYDAAAHRGQTITESTPISESRGIHLPYSQSKWVTETLVQMAAARGIPVTIHRPAFISGSSVNGAWNTADFLCRMLKAVVEMGALPGDLDLDLDFSPVDYVSRSIIHLSRQASSIGRAFHLHHPRAIHLRTFHQILRSFGYDISAIPYWNWVQQIEGRTDGPLYPLLPFLRQRWHPEELSYVELGQRCHRPRLTCEKTLEALVPAGIECPLLDHELIGRYLEYLAATGFIVAPRAPIGEGRRGWPNRCAP